MNKLPLPSSQCVVWCWPWLSLCWSYFNFQSLWIPSRVFLPTPIWFLQPHHIAHHHPVVVLWLLLVLAIAPWLLLLLPWPLLYKEAVSRTLCSLSASASRVAATGAETALNNFEIELLKNEFIVLLIYFWEIFLKFYGHAKTTFDIKNPRKPGQIYDKKWRFNYWSYTLN